MKTHNALKNQLISIVMPVFNTADYLTEAIQSLQQQTHQNWELIVVDDASTDKSLSILKKFAKKDKRIRVLENTKNKGVSFTANKALKKAKSKFIARMDSDDISLPNRLANQLAFLQQNPKVVAVGGQCQVINQNGTKIGRKNFPTNPDEVKKMLFSFAAIQQPTMMVNTTLLPKKFTWYENDLAAAEEHELLFRFLQFGQLANLPKTVLKYRMHGQNISSQHPKVDFKNILKARFKAIQKYGYRPTIKNILINIAQTLVFLALPEKIIYRLYTLLRGWKSDTTHKTQKTTAKQIKLPSLSVFFPMHNEESNVARVLTQAQEVIPQIAKKYEIIIVNDGSSDQTSKIAKKFAKNDKHIVVIDQENMGYGGALQTGFKAAKFDWIFFADGDLQFNLQELKKFTPQTSSNQVIIGFRKKRADSYQRLILASLLKIWNQIFFQFPRHIKDIDCAFKLFHRDVITQLFPLSSVGAMISTELLLKLLDQKYEIAQIGVTHYPRLYGEQTGAKWNVISGAIKETIYLVYHRSIKSRFSLNTERYLPFLSRVGILILGFTKLKS